MTRVVLTTALLILTLFSASHADDLYRVTIQDRVDATMLRQTGVTAVVQLNDGYLVLTSADSRSALMQSGLTVSLIAQNVELRDLVLSNRFDRAEQEPYTLLFGEGQVRLYRLPRQARLSPDAALDIRAVEPIEIVYREASSSVEDLIRGLAGLDIDLDSMINLISEDSIRAYVDSLEGPRVAGTAENRAARNWIFSKLRSFGYDSVYFDPFRAPIGGQEVYCYNVVAVKVGSQLPDHQIVMGAHFDAVPGSPGADDNASGTVGVLETARVLADLDNDMTMVYVLFDAEEWGLYGSYHYAQEAYDRGDNIVFMLNMDMIAWYSNDADAALYHGMYRTYAELWAYLAESFVGIEGHYEGVAANSDHYPFAVKGWPVVLAHEYIFSGVYHSSKDTYNSLNFDYMRRMIQASAATAYGVSDQFYGMNFAADTTFGWAPLDVTFSGSTDFDADSWTWYFGDGDTDTGQIVSHRYSFAGCYDVEMEITFDSSVRSQRRTDYIVVLADSVIASSESSGSRVAVEIYARNTLPLLSMVIPFDYGGNLAMQFDSISLTGTRTEYFNDIIFQHIDDNNRLRTVNLISSLDGSQPHLAPGTGPVATLHFTVEPGQAPGTVGAVEIDGYGQYYPTFGYVPSIYTALATNTAVTYSGCCMGTAGNIDDDLAQEVDISDLTTLVNHLFVTFDQLPCAAEAQIVPGSPCAPDISDLTALVNSLFITFDQLPACAPECE